ncbi:hypothetical protein [Coleofasciculus sp. FACHB-1120]|uniref:hypothetical protein n=1 Tax=Coleofasciculus sp. FACHB-1120 TaxID=2692783 RepID=UPI001685676A|nr:hypothetical protein [Coleofasciculus sp. FACHB-1120]MBD2744936.1 hypothetical protein [Coleofasciculus sp. FACHB-1120]
MWRHWRWLLPTEDCRRRIAVERSDISYLRDRFVKVTTEPPQKVALDGELIGTTPVEIECIPGSLTILVSQLL